MRDGVTCYDPIVSCPLPRHGSGVLELGAQWIHGGCHGNAIYNLAARCKLLGEKVCEVGRQKY